MAGKKNSGKKRSKKKLSTQSSSVQSDSNKQLAEIHRAVDKLPSAQRQQFLQATHVESSFSGPLPPPEDFGLYEKTLSGAANRILIMAETEQKIRSMDSERNHKILDKDLTGFHHNNKILLNRAFLLGLGLLIITSIAVWNNNALIALPLGMLGGITTLIKILTERKKDKDSKDHNNT